MDDDNRSGPLVSIVITNFNYARYLRGAIDSALRQTYARVEVIVVDDGSTDDSREIIVEYSQRVVPVLKANGGLASAINAGVAVARGELVSWLDADDVFLPQKIQTIVNAYRHHPDAVLIYHRLQTTDVDGRPLAKPWPRDVWTGDVGERVARTGGWWPRPTSSAMTYSRRFLQEILPMRECSELGSATWPDAYAGDLAPFFGKLVGLPQALTLYRLHGKNSQLRFDPQKQLRQSLFEYEQLQNALQRFGKHVALEPLDHHLWYMHVAYAADPAISRWQMLWLTLTCPLLTTSGRLIELAKLILRPRARASGLLQ
jgi:glycosyltransferase involved in cell wall biosynthesis